MITIMKKLFNLNYIVLLAVLALFSACTEDNEYVPAGPCAENNGYWFNAESSSNVIVGLNDSVYKIVVERAVADAEETIGLVVKGDLKTFTVPTALTFAAGESQAVIEVAIDSTMAAYENYYLEISIDETLINPYKTDNFSILPMTFVKEDYAPYAVGNYTSWLFGQTWPAVLEYSPMLDLYRFKDCWVKGDVTFRVTNPETMEFEMTESSFGTGYDYQPGAEVYADVYGEYNYFDFDTNTFYFAYMMWIPALNGAFNGGNPAYDTYQITEYAE